MDFYVAGMPYPKPNLRTVWMYNNAAFVCKIVLPALPKQGTDVMSVVDMVLQMAQTMHYPPEAVTLILYEP